MKIVTITDADAERWDAFVAASPTATFYHQYRWRTALQRAYDLETTYLAAEDDGRILGILPLATIAALGGGRTWISLPFANYGGIAADTPSAATALLDAARERLTQAARYVEFKQVVRVEDARLVDKLHYHSLELALQADPDLVWKDQVDSKARNQVRKARKEGVEAVTGRDRLPQFLDVYRRHLRDLGTPTHAMLWFTTLADLFGANMEIVLALVEGKAVAGGWLFFYKDTAILHSAASLEAYNRLCPNNLVYWTAIELACRRGCRTIDFARSRIGAGTYHFKQQWGAQPRQTYYQYLLNTATAVPDLDPHNPRFSLATTVWRHLPLPLANALGPMLRKRITT